ncbi:hypothetical protein PYW07_008461 [Mythimna separata]|uniref:Uncharacterized protein n=1 Tax=Mythimna separata TaxID=271217 RepID=A0AAD7YCQ4_MYTSE|nr:hypothetical protein PYW07_008461 [Mythimna separata]
MVFCYKIITESPRRPGLSPRKKSPLCNVRSSISQLIRSFDYENCSDDIVDSIPEREWKLLAALARKREDDIERDKLADQFRQLWQKEKEEREIVEAETVEQYKRYIIEKRRAEKSRHEFKQYQKSLESQLRREMLMDCIRHKEQRSADLLAHIDDQKVMARVGVRQHEFKQYQKSLESQLRREMLMDCIRHKEQRSADLLAHIDDQKTCFLVDKVLEEEARAQLAADRRIRQGEAEQFRKHIDFIDKQRKGDNAVQRKTKLLRDTTQRVAIQNALSSWESSLLRQEVIAMDAARRAQHAAHAALTDARSVRLMRARDARRRRAKNMAAVTQQLREAIISGR